LLTFSIELVYLRWSVRELDFENMKILSLEWQDSKFWKHENSLTRVTRLKVWCGRSGPTFDAAKQICLWCQHGYYQPWSIANSFGWWHPMSFISMVFFALGWLPSMPPDNVQGCKRQFVVDGSLCRDACGFLYLEP
jgi:hypothetical protein